MLKSHLKHLVSIILIASIGGSCVHEPPVVCPEPIAPTPLELDIPQGFPPMAIPDDNPMTVEGVALGRKLFYDKQLSDDNTQACATCHQTEVSYADSNRFSTGIDGSIGDRNAMAVINLGYSFSLFWDGRSATLEAQALEPVKNPIEMNTTWPQVLDKLNADEDYRSMFKFAFGVDVIDSFDVAKAIAQFERTMISGNSRFDKSQRGEIAFTDSERRGQVLFFTERADCFHCHGTSLFMGFVYENNGVQQVLTDDGLGGVTGVSFDIAKFKPPTLRNIEFTAPYMHDGQFNTLEEVIEFYNTGVNQSSPNISPLMLKANRFEGKLNLTDQEKADLLAFLLTLSDPDFLNNPDFMEP
jgi:cytochrome c peroxidase